MNRHRSLKALALALPLFAMVQAPAVAQVSSAGQGGQKVLSVRPHFQHTRDWCWAAAMAMVVEYITGRPIEDCQVLSLYDRSLNGPGACCQGERACQRTGSARETSEVLEDVFNIHSVELDEALSFDEVKDYIDEDRPIIAYLWKTSTQAHAVVICGYREPDRVIIIDPMVGEHWVPYEGLRSNVRYGDWTQSTLIKMDRKTGLGAQGPGLN